MKKLIVMITVIVLSVPIVFGNGEASAAEKFSSKAPESLMKSLQIDSFKLHVLNSLKDEYPKAHFVDITPVEYLRLKGQKSSVNPSVVPYSSAPPLTYLQVYAAISTNYPQYEYFNENQLSSVQDHGGAEMYIVTVELGYGNRPVAKFNGGQLTETQNQYIDLDGDSIIDGWFRWWDASGSESGTFTYQNTSTNYPWNTMYDSINIK
ncbi:DUF4879 domain-containing protein [Tuberibacillus calidus]|jgi:hypothetical protein|uniref:DUF4879 domain-containing protein n=1 Tax=Tuberibacillus calidus TaxID=340097 RepID=UPI00040FF4B8|nr:DUF4879 domain-containing protein [Tuberibacillus calidus]